jgi:hypothetical protein
MIARIHASPGRAWNRFTAREEGSVLPKFLQRTVERQLAGQNTGGLRSKSDAKI